MRACPLCRSDKNNFYTNYEIDYQICNNCDIIFGKQTHDTEYDSTVHSEAYNSDYIEYLHNFEFDARLLFTIMSLIDTQKKSKLKILDAGCGVGFFLDFSRFLGFETKGIEPSIPQSEFARKNMQLDVFTGFLQDLKHIDKFDVIYCSEVIEHIENPLPFCKHIFSLLNDSGILIFTTPNFRSKELGEPKDETFTARAGKFLSQYHVTVFSKKSMIKLLTLSGFDNIIVTSFYGSENDERILGIARKDRLEIRMEHELIEIQHNKHISKYLIPYLQDLYKRSEKQTRFWFGVLQRLITVYSQIGEHEKSNEFSKILFESLKSKNITRLTIQQDIRYISSIEKFEDRDKEIIDILNKIPPYLPDIYWALGMNFLNLGKHNDALEVFNEAELFYKTILKLPNLWILGIYNYYINVFNRANKSTEEIRLLDIIYHKGLCLLFLKQNIKAIECFDVVLKSKLIDKKKDLMENALLNKGIALLQIGKYYSAKEEFERISNNIDSKLIDLAELHIALCFKHLGKTDNSHKIFDKLLEKETINSDLRSRIISEKKNL